MSNEINNKVNPKIVFSYLVLGVLAIVAGYFIYSEIQVFLAEDTVSKNDRKLLKTGVLVTKLYEAENQSKLALQTKSTENFDAYAQKIDSIYSEIDTLKSFTKNEEQKLKLDSVITLLEQKVANNNELIILSTKNNGNNSIETALKEIDKIEESYGKFSAENLFSNFEQFSPNLQQSLREYAALLSKNAPTNADGSENAAYIDSILKESKLILEKALKKSAKTQRSLAQKEIQITKNDQELTQQLQGIISDLEQDIIRDSYAESLAKKAALRKSIRWAGIAAILAFIIVGIFSFLINRDFWKIQTYQRQLEKEKKYSESLLRSREQLISTVSHDLRTPLNTISGYADLMDNTDLTTKQSEYIKNVKSASAYVDNLVNDLLDFSKLEAGKLNIEKVPFIAAHLIQETAENLQELYKNKNLKLNLILDKNLHQTYLGDPFRIRQILTNLIGNAYKFTEEGFIEINARSTAKKGKTKTILIEVTDTGIGIAKEKQQLIFKEFSQAESNTDKKYGGHGLGLTISKKLAELLNGSLSLESAVAKGSTFKLELPLELTNELVKSTKEAPYLAPKLRMLIIDDDTALLHMLKELAESMKITAHTFTNFLQIDKDSHLAYDIVLTDIQMPQITGFEVLQKLKSGDYKHYNKQPIIAMTGRRDLEKEAYTSIGFAEVIQKPFSKQELITVLKLMGIETQATEDIKPIETATDTVNSINEPYSLEFIYSFLGENEDAIQEVLVTFLMDTETNMKLLEDTINNLDQKQINHVAHRMLPMFRQLKVNSVIPILERLELLKESSTNSYTLQKDLKTLKENVGILAKALKRRLFKDQAYSG
ncbi:ATP-binding protein [Aurantibacter sp.]|uniref:hybrid sensor histidine kinase/response regulator n=1 Tax=Aurantibacter sp. TaxID=2807103 RepID=UPI003264274D